MSFEGSGADYLRRLRQDQERPVERSSPRASPALAAATGGSAERRQSPRYKCEGSAQFRVAGSGVRTWGTFTDLSMHGCYIELTAQVPVGAKLALALELNGQRVELKGEVRVSYPSLGIGVAFREILEENRMRLQEMVRSLLPAARIGMPVTATTNSTNAPGFFLPPIVNPAAAMQTLVDFFEVGRILTQEEFVRLIRKSQSSAR